MTVAASATALQALGFAAGAALCAQLWWSQRSFTAAGDPASGGQRFSGLWLSGLWWSGACFVQRVMSLQGVSSLEALAEWTAWGSTCFGPWLSVRLCEHWRVPCGANSMHGWRILSISALLSGGALAASWLALWLGTIAMTLDSFSVLALYASLLHALACGTLLRRQPRAAPSLVMERGRRRWLVRIAVALLCVQVGVTLLNIHAPQRSVSLHVLASLIGQHWVIPWALLVATLLAQAHRADVVLKRSSMLLASVTAATLLVWWIPGLPRGIPLLSASLSGTALLLAAPTLQRAIHALVDRGILRRPDYGALLREFADASARAADPDELFALLRARMGAALRVDVRIVAATASVAASASLLRVALDEAHSIELTPSPRARALLEEERSFVDGMRIAGLRRLQALELERTRREQQLREERLQRSVAEAELRALRAQVDPHFLFNTLNTIAELIGTDAARAEAMTERLAEFFRYTLTRQERTLATLEEELRFVRHYLEIEQVRFGERLQFDLLQDAAVGQQQVPALILQPLVENAVRHGLAPKIGPGSICVSASREGEFLQLQVEDNGVGMPSSCDQRQGVGLRNVRERLRVLYRESAVLSIGAGAGGRGTRVTLLLPSRVPP